MILIDFSQLAISNLHQHLKSLGEGHEFHPDLLRHMILNSIRRLNRKFTNEWGQLVICTDSTNYWRKQIFPHYKANRKKGREASDIDWDMVFDTLGHLRDEIKENFPYKVVAVPTAEADDIIATICKHYHQQEAILILSGDKDFLQLQRYPNVQQYGPVQDQFLTTDDPILFLKEHIIRGDKGDGVPNFLCADDVFITGTRQTAIRDVKLQEWLKQEPEEFCDEQQLKQYQRNKQMVDLSQIPADIEQAIVEEYKVPIVGSRDRIYQYLVKKRMSNLLSMCREF